MIRGRVLVVDDKETFLALFRRIAPVDLEIVCASDGARALGLLAAEHFDVVVSDIRMPGADGMTLLKKVRADGIDVEVILMTAYGTIADAVRAMKYGAADYLTKPFDPDEAVSAIEQALERRRSARLRSGAIGPEDTPELLGESVVMKHVVELIDRAAESDATVIITGGNGTGKELVARTIHARSSRMSKRFVPVNCGALPESVVDSELFGYVEGACARAVGAKRGLFEEAASGTLFLDEIGELPIAVQAKLTRALQERVIRKVGATDELAVNVRIIGATNIDLRKAVDDGRFREDLFYRLHVLSIALPPLCERREDIPILAEGLLARTVASSGRTRRLSADALACLCSYDWPGNVRELENALARATAISPGEEIGIDALPTEIRVAATHGGPAHPTVTTASLPYREAIAVERERATREYLINLLRDVQGNVTQAAERAGIERESFHRLMKRHGVRSEDYRPR